MLKTAAMKIYRMGCRAVEQSILGGCTMIQLREKNISSLDFYKQAIAIKEITDKYFVPLIINDRFDIALAVNAARCFCFL